MAEAAIQAAPEPMVEVFARPGSRISNDAAERIFREAQRLPERERTAENLVGLAEDPTSAIHDLFTWSDQEAAKKFREQEARVLMNSVKVRIVTEHEVTERPAFYSVRFEEEPQQMMSYVRYSTAVDDEALAERLVQRAYRDLRSFQMRYAKHRSLFQSAAPELLEILKIADDLV